MNKNLKSVLLVGVLILSTMLGGCGNKALEGATLAVDEYNAKAQAYNEKIVPYNEAVVLFNKANDDLQAMIDGVQNIINKGEKPYNEETLVALKEALSAAVDAKADNMNCIEEVEMFSVNEEMDTISLTELTEKAVAYVAEIEKMEVPEIPDIIDYSAVLKKLEECLSAYENSVQSMKQVTVPTDDFVIARLQMIETITEIAAVTEDHDPNGKLNKQGGYIGCIYFFDSQVKKENLYIEAGKNNVIDIGTDGGGCVEIYNSVEEAETRDAYLASFDGTFYASGSHYIIGTCLVRTSNELTGIQQKELTDAIFEMLLKVE